ncbi:MAG: phenylalanine--tRNA ligase subunit beta [Ostreibacterium sp.]
MLISKNWLADFVNINADTQSICEKLTNLGLEVEGVLPAAPAFNGVVVGQVMALEKHPDADNLRIASVNIGIEDLLSIVCGASNISVGMLVPVATVGAVLPNNIEIKKSTLRGVPSFGMLCSESELGLSEKSSGLMVLPKTIEMGIDIRKALDLDDEIIDIGVTPNRGDCLSVLGVARELAVAFGETLHEEDYQVESVIDESLAVTLSAPEACPRYFTRTISGLNNRATTPFWVVERLRRAGMRSLSPVIDVTNYVMLELGTPMHAFNAEKIDIGITIRMANEGEVLVLLDGKKIRLDSDMLVIADNQKAIALAGIMGGGGSEIDGSSTRVILESAWFSPSIIAGRARRIGLQTDASYRFERGVDFTMQKRAIERATQLIIEICGGQVHSINQTENNQYLPSRSPIQLQASHVDKILGFEFPKKEIKSILSDLGMTVVENQHQDEETFYTVTVPNYRFDLTIEEDLIEELVRVYGYDKVPVNAINIQKLSNQVELNKTNHQLLNHLLVHMGYDEAITYSFIDEKYADLLSDTDGTVKLMNPLSTDFSVMRSSLLPSLVKALSYNVKRQQTNIRLYEYGHGYHATQNDVVTQTEKLAGIVTGQVYPIQWGFRQRVIDFFDIKGDVEKIVDQLGVSHDISYQRSERNFLHPGQSADVLYQGNMIGFVGALHPTVQKILDIDTRVLAFELDIATINQTELPVVRTIAKYPEIRRDISLLMAQGHQSEEVLATIRQVGSHLLTNVVLFDVYIGRNIPKNTKSMAIAIYLQDKEKTLTDEQADEVIHQLVTTLTEKFNAELRG